MPHPIPRNPAGGIPRRRAFSLVLSLTVMAMLLILCVGAAALLSIELRVANASVSMARARMNAMIGARVAFGELQRLMGPDQRVSATADILSAPDRTDPTQASTYTGPNGAVIHPRWVGVWNTGRTDDDNTSVGAGPSQEKKLIYRTTSGTLGDARYATNPQGSGGVDAWTKNRAGITMNRSGKRLMGWLVSGAEALPHTDGTAPTPFTAVDTTNDIVALGQGTLGSLFSPTRTATDMLGSRVRKVAVTTDNTGNTAGAYAYWVADEGVKARFNIRDKFESAGITPSGSAPGNGGLARFLVSQRSHVDPTSTRSAISGAPSLPDINYTGAKTWDKVTSFDDLPLASNSGGSASSPYQASTLRPYYYHDFTFNSAGIDVDVENGGLKKDLGYYLTTSGDVADYGGIHGSGIVGSSAILPVDDPSSGASEPSLTQIFPKFSLLKNWWTSAPGYAATNGNTPVATVAPVSYQMSYTQKTTSNGAAPADPLFTVQVPTLGDKATTASLSPVVTQMTMYYKPVYDDSGGPGSFQARILVYPQIVLWNPYPVAISLNAPVIDWLNDWCVYANIAANSGSGSVTYIATRPHLSYKLPSVTLKPGQSVSFVADTGANTPIIGNMQPSVAFAAKTVTMKQGLPTTANYYVDALSGGGGWGTSLVSATPNTPIAGVGIGYCTATFTPGAFNEQTMATDQVILRDGAKSLLHYKLDRLNTAASKFLVTDGRIYATKPLTDQWGQGIFLSTLAVEQSSPTPVSQMLCVGFRAKRLDNTESADTISGGLRGLTVNPFTDMNIRAARQTRSPFDAQDVITPQSSGSKKTNVTLTFNYTGQYMGGIWTEDFAADQTMASLGPAAADKMVPFYASSLGRAAPNYPGCILFDLPYSDVGVLGLGQLDCAPLNPLDYGPSMPFGSARIPVADLSGQSSLTNSTGAGVAGANQMWSNIAAWGSAGQEQLRQISAIGSQTSDVFDVSYELNHTLWDTYRVSGIAASNNGWNIASGAWQNDTATSGNFARTLPSSRYLPADGTFPARTGFFAAPAYKLYHASYTLLEQGAFNVNSTSRVAWISLLTSCRGLGVPTTGGGTVANNNSTAFLRLLRPKGGNASGSTGFTENVWSGYRALSDLEIQTLADKIVSEVRKRGPFMSLSDFVNRRLKTPSSGDYADWTTRESDYLGTLEAAITTAGINDTIGTNSIMDRTSRDTFTVGLGKTLLAQQTERKPQHRAKHLIAGTPGYLQQSDILRSVGNALTVRSDTFTIRSYGESDNASAWVEVTVQRYPQPLVAGTGNILPVNPKSIDPNSAYAGNQFFGRRMKIVATRWLDKESI